MIRLINRASDVYTNEGLIQLFKSTAAFSSNTISYNELTTSFLTHFLKIYDRESLEQYCRNESTDHSIYYYSNQEQCTITSPISLDVIPTKFEDIIGKHSLDQPFVAVLKNSAVLNNGIVVTSNGTILLENLDSRRDRIEENMRFKDWLNLMRSQNSNTEYESTSYDYEVACPLVSAPKYGKVGGAAPQNQGHSGIIINLLPRLEGIKKYEEETGKSPVLILGPNTRRLLIEMLELLGFDKNRIVEWKGEELYIKKMIVPSGRTPETNLSKYRHQLKGHAYYKSVSKYGIQWVRDTSLHHLTSEQNDFSNRIYISRQDASRRRIKNHEEVLNVLSKYGFESYELSQYSWEEQVEMFSQAEAVVAPHGAGLANIAFASGCKVVEIFGPKRKPTFFLLSEKLGLDYAMVTSQTKKGHIVVNTMKLHKILDRLNIY